MKKWTKEDNEDLILGYDLELPLIVLSDIFTVSKRTISRKAQELGILHPLGPKCTKYTDKTYKLALKEKCPEIILLDKYINIHTKILHKCLVCEEEHLAEPNTKLQGYGHCGRKNNSGILSYNKPGIVYLVYIPLYDLYKIGITSKTVKERFKDNKLSSDKYNIILERHFNTGIECEALEKEWLSNIKEYKVNTKLLRTGNTETFRLENYESHSR